jgi:hypothetical protein
MSEIFIDLDYLLNFFNVIYKYSLNYFLYLNNIFYLFYKVILKMNRNSQVFFKVFGMCNFRNTFFFFLTNFIYLFF